MTNNDLDYANAAKPEEKRPPIPLTILPNGTAIWPTRALLFPTGYPERSVAAPESKK